MIDQIKCAKKGSNKYGIPLFVNQWLPEMERYALDYVGMGDIIGSTSNKRAKKTTIGYNKFVPLGSKCGITSDAGCRGEEKHAYLKAYPLGYLPICKNKETVGKYDILGGTGLLGSIQEDLYNLNVGDSMAGLFGSGPLASDDCMKVRLPVGDRMLRWKESTKEEVEDRGYGWYTEEKCVPRGPTVNKKYGGQTFSIPYSESKCTTENFTNQKNIEDEDKFLIKLLIILLVLLMALYIIHKIFVKKKKYGNVVGYLPMYEVINRLKKKLNRGI